MKKIAGIICTSILCAPVFSQVKKLPVKPVAPKPVLNNLRDSASYTAGIFIVNRYLPQGISGFNTAIIKRAVDDLQAGKKQLVSDANADKVILAYQQMLKSKTKPPVKPAAAGIVLKNLRDSASYVAGIFMISFFKSVDVTNLNSAVVARAVNDLQTGKPRLLNDNQANKAVMDYQYKLQMIKSKANIEAGEKFLAENKKRPEVKTTASGLQYEIITQGEGPVPQNGDVVNCNYCGTYIDGKEFDNSAKAGKPVSFSINGVIKGWTEALLMMPVGSKWKLYVPYQLGYGPGDYRDIPGGSVLLFDIELVSITGK
jgi:FKBP-type peptidyl-prolyl cis-trans isomerase FklB